MRVFLAGGTGVIGRPLIEQLVAAGHQVTATTRRPSAVETLRSAGAEPVVVDALDRDALCSAVHRAAPEVVLHQLTAIPPRIEPRRVLRDMAATNRLRVEGTRYLLEAAAAAGARRVVAQSLAFAYRPVGRGPHREEDELFLDAPASYRPLIEAVASLEEQVLGHTAIEGVVLRYGLLYGPGTVYEPGGTFYADLARRKVPILGAGTGVFSMLHVDDAAAAAVRALDGPPGVYNIVDDHPTPAREFLTTYADLAGARRPFSVPVWLGRLAAGAYGVYFMVEQRGASNQLARRRLGWQPRHPDWRAGFEAMLSAAAAD